MAWFLAPYKRRDRIDPATSFVISRGRYCAMDDFTAQILADGGSWAESEVLGDVAVVKVSASAATLTTMAQTAGFQRIPARFLSLSQTLGDLTSGERNAILTRLQALGYSTAEITAALGSNLSGWRSRTLGQLLRFIATRRLKPRYDVGTDTILLDGAIQPTRPIADIDAAVS